MGTGESLFTRLRMEKDPGRAELTASAAVGHDVSFFWHHAHHNPSFPATWFCRLLTFTKTGMRTFFTPWKCVALCNSILSVHPASPTAIATFRESSALGADLSRCECGCDFHHKCKFKHKTYNCRNPQHTAQSFVGATRGVRNPTAHSISFFFFSLSFKFFYFSFSCYRNQGGQTTRSRIGPSFRNLSILLISCKKELYTLVVLCHLAGITENTQQFLIGSPRV